MLMKNPPHPGEHIRYDCIQPLGLTISAAAKELGVTRQALNNVVNGKSAISPEMAIRLSMGFGGSPDVWLTMQAQYDLAQAMQNADRIDVQRIRSRSEQEAV